MHNRFHALACALLVTILTCFCSTSVAQIIYENNFDQHTYNRTYKDADLDAEWNFPAWESGISERRVKIQTGYQAVGNSGSCLAVKSPKGTYGTSKSGASWKMEFDQSYTEVYVSYVVKFKRGFDFVKGGKLPGLAGGTAPTGFTKATGYNGWTARMMWTTPFKGTPGSPKQKTANGISYAKYVGSGYRGNGKNEDKTMFLDDNEDAFTFKSNVWYSITQRVRMNDPSVKNGILQIWIDGNMVIDQQDIEYRKTVNLGIDQFYFSNFFGGGSSWRTSKYETMYFDNFIIFAAE